MDDKKKIVAAQKKIEEVGDEQLEQVNGGLTTPTVTGDENLSGNENPFGIKLGQTMKKPTFNR